MSFAPYAALWILMVAAAGICLPAGRRPRLPIVISIAATLFAFGLWALFRPAVDTPALAFAGRQWAIGEVGWSLTGIVLLVLLSASVHALISPELLDSTRHAALSLGATAAALPAIWAADERTRIMGVTVFAVPGPYTSPRSRGRLSRRELARPAWRLVRPVDGRVSLVGGRSAARRPTKPAAEHGRGGCADGRVAVRRMAQG